MKSLSSFRQTAIFAAAAILCGAASATTVVLDATQMMNSVSLNLDAGTYYIKYLSGAWTPWADVVGCDQNGESCTNGWVNSYFYSSANSSGWVGDGGRYATPSQAEAHGVWGAPTQITFAQAGELTLLLPDGYYPDNSGSITLSVSAVPEPLEAAMMLGGLGVVGVIARRRRRSA
jgi:hypothetical protein